MDKSELEFDSLDFEQSLIAMVREARASMTHINTKLEQLQPHLNQVSELIQTELVPTFNEVAKSLMALGCAIKDTGLEAITAELSRLTSDI